MTGKLVGKTKEIKQTGRIPDKNMVHLCLYKVNQINFEYDNRIIKDGVNSNKIYEILLPVNMKIIREKGGFLWVEKSYIY